MDEDRYSVKRDRTARLIRVLRVVEAAGEAGVRPDEIARRVGMSKRNVYRDLHALEEEVDIPLWNEGGRWGVAQEAFLPPLKLTLSEAMAIVLSARLMVRYADKHDPDLAGAFQKLQEVLPAALREHVERTLEALARREIDAKFSRHVHLLTQAWVDRRVVTLSYAGIYGPEPTLREARVRPYLIEPSLQTHALYLIGWDETRDAMRTFKIERIVDLALTPQSFDPPAVGDLEAALGPAWDIIADQPEVDVVLRFDRSVAPRVREAIWHPTQRLEPADDGSLVWRARVSGTIEVRVWILSWGSDVEVVSPQELRDDIAATLERAATRYRR